ncbi:MAG: CsgG/HfaB family protein [Myxococcota bacterium]
MRFLVLLVTLVFPSSALADDTRLALTYFEVHSVRPEYQPLGRAIADMLISDLSRSKDLTVVERSRLNEVLDELQLQRSEILDAQSAVAVGMLVGAELIVVGGISEVGDNLRIDARAIEVSTSEVVAAVVQEGRADQFFRLEERVAKDLAKAISGVELVERYTEEAPPTQAAVSYGQAIEALDEGRDRDAAVAAARASREGRRFKLANALALETEGMRPVGLSFAVDTSVRPNKVVMSGAAGLYLWPLRRLGVYTEVGIPWVSGAREQDWIFLPMRGGAQLRLLQTRDWNKRTLILIGGAIVADPARVKTSPPSGGDGPSEATTTWTPGWEVNTTFELNSLDAPGDGGIFMRLRAGRQGYPWMTQDSSDKVRFMGATFGLMYYFKERSKGE